MTARRIRPQASASKRSLARDLASPLALPTKAVEGFRSLLGAGAVSAEHATAPAVECADARPGSGVEPPAPFDGVPANHLERSFFFADVSGFTAYVDRHGEHAAIEVLTRFRGVVRNISARRGVRVGKWLGDGVMLVGVEPTVVVAAAGEMLCHFSATGIDIHGGLASGPVLLFEGDDYIGRPVNLAARLCDAAAPGELLAVVDQDQLPAWVASRGQVTVQITGVGDVTGVRRLEVASDVLTPFRSAAAA